MKSAAEPRGSTMASVIALQGSRLHQRAGSHSLCVVLHGYGMQASEMEDWLLPHLAAVRPLLDVLFLQAPVQWNASSSRFVPSWLSYVHEFHGTKEDVVDARLLEQHLFDIRKGIDAVKGPYTEVLLVGLSEGGCVALELAARYDFQAVVTLVSYRRRDFSHLPLKCPWHALIAQQDEVFPAWAAATTEDATSLLSVDDDHFLHKTDQEVVAFLLRSIQKCLS